ncbi:hypothetical protein [Ilumatobacter nonamiensis]|uniref:hypothetical protein n=1 Tax=Ilumatobacter nonamiensis TaxID=467093 RepID=UPI00034DA54A|nr:hypothetical protein [Ilumatobacter nonamiensis]
MRVKFVGRPPTALSSVQEFLDRIATLVAPGPSRRRGSVLDIASDPAGAVTSGLFDR